MGELDSCIGQVNFAEVVFEFLDVGWLLNNGWFVARKGTDVVLELDAEIGRAHKLVVSPVENKPKDYLL